MKAAKATEAAIGLWKAISVTTSRPETARPRQIAPLQVGGPFPRGVRRLDRARACASARLRGRARIRVPMRPPWVPRCLRRRRFLVCAISVSLREARPMKAALDQVPLGVETADREPRRE